jgi:glycosyltransferase involved in cell wall biosynthesis
VPDDAGAFWERREAALACGQPAEKLSPQLHIERVARRILEGHYGLAWSRAASRAARAIIEGTPSIRSVISSHPPIGVHLSAMQFARAYRLRWIADFRDPVRYGAGRVSRWCTKSLEQRIFHRADAIIANTEAAADRWRRMFPWAERKIHVIWNGFDPDEEQSALPLPARPERWLVHAGSLYHNRNANVVVAALARLRDRKAPQAERVRIVLAGVVDKTAGVDEGVHSAAIADGWLEMSGSPIPRDQADRLVREAHGLLLLQPQSANQVPAKLFQYLCIGRPILAVAPRRSPIEWILGNAGVPFVCIHPDDPEEETDRKLLAYLDHPPAITPANEWFRTSFDGRRQTEHLASLLAGNQ